MHKPFQKISALEKRTHVFHVRMTAQEASTIERLAKSRHLTVSEFIRRTATGRKIETRFEDQIILALRDIMCAIMFLRSSIEKGQVSYMEGDWEPILIQIISTMQNISR